MGEDKQQEAEETPFPLTTMDRDVLATKDEDFHRVTWEDLRKIIANNTLEDLMRTPEDLKKYMAWSTDVKSKYGTVPDFVLKERLFWEPKTTDPITFSHHSDTPFADERDFVVLINDWPYGFADGIKHLLVWTKTPVAVDDERGDVTPESRQLIEDFIERFFANSIGPDGKDNVQWFKNWVKLQSVRGLDHVHVMVRDVPQELLDKWTERKDL